MSDFSEETGIYQRALQHIGVPLAILASIASLIGLYYQIKKPAPSLEVRILAKERLTASPPIPALVAEYKYQERVVKDLWRVTFQVTNPGGTTLITQGETRNVISEGIEMRIKKGFDFLGFETSKKFEGLNVTKSAENALVFRFLQWMKDENVVMNLFLERVDPSLAIGGDVFLFERVLADGKINVVVAEEGAAVPKQPLIDRWSPFFGNVTRAIIYILCGFILLLGFIMPFVGLRQFKDERRQLKWRNVHRDAAITHLKERHPNSESLKLIRHFPRQSSANRVLSQKSMSEWKDIWSDFEGVPPEEGYWLSEQAPKPVTSLFASFFAALGFISIAAAIAATITIR